MVSEGFVPVWSYELIRRQKSDISVLSSENTEGDDGE